MHPSKLEKCKKNNNNSCVAQNVTACKAKERVDRNKFGQGDDKRAARSRRRIAANRRSITVRLTRVLLLLLLFTLLLFLLLLFILLLFLLLLFLFINVVLTFIIAIVILIVADDFVIF